MNILQKYAAVAIIAAKTNLAYISEVGGRMLFLTVILYIFLCLWKATFAYSGSNKFSGYGLTEMLWYITFTECIILSAPRITPQIDEDVRTGAIAVQLVRPVSYPLFRLATNLGEQAVKFVLTLIPGFLVAWWLVGIPENLAYGLFLAGLTVPFAFALDFLGYFLVGLGAFWFDDTVGPALIYTRTTAIAGGLLLPIELFPEALQGILRLLPFSYIVNGPARLFVHPDLTTLSTVLINQTIWLAILGCAVALVYRKAVGRIALNGG